MTFNARQTAVLILIVLNVFFAACPRVAGGSGASAAPDRGHHHLQAPAAPAAAGIPSAHFSNDVEARAPSAEDEDEDIYLESLEDLDHLSYLSLRNYNLTDDALLQSSWLMGLGTVLSPHKLHQMDETAAALSMSTDKKIKLPLMLESFISHLRNGHLRRMSLEDLEQVSNALNLTESFDSLRQRRLEMFGDKLRSAEARNQTSSSSESEANNEEGGKGAASERLSNDETRCVHLVTLYKFDLSERQRNQQQQQQQSKVEYESSQNFSSPPESPSSSIGNQQALPLQQQANEKDASAVASNNQDQERQQRLSSVDVDEIRLIRLCKLAITCRSADELVSLISKPWKLRNGSAGDPSHGLTGIENSQLERDTSQEEPEQMREPMKVAGNQQPANADETRQRRKSLRDSLSLSLAKLCPLILFPLHEDDGQCSLRRDDRPPMITVWGFATLFVTIVCFCSLIGLSITPLLGQSPADSSVSSEASEPLTGLSDEAIRDLGQLRRQSIEKRQQHKASLTLFEGLAVGSLVGSALFSLIPQAFELQERESNHSFLLKAFIIFSGIYLFFCSERIMRIILDTRQMRKKKKRQTLHRSSTTAALDGLVADSHQHQLQHQHPYQQSRQQHSSYHSAHSHVQGQPQMSWSNRVQEIKPSQTTSAGQATQTPSSGKKKHKTKHESISSASKRSRVGLDLGAVPIDASEQLKRPPAPIKSKSRQSRQQQTKSDEEQQQVTITASNRLAMKKQARKGNLAKASQRSSVGGHHVRRQEQQQQHLTISNRAQQKHWTSKRPRRQKFERDEGNKRRHLAKQVSSPSTSKKASTALREADMQEDYDDSSQSYTSSSRSTSSSSFSSYTLNRLKTTEKELLAKTRHAEESPCDYSLSSSRSDLSLCSSCASFDNLHGYHTDSDEDNNQARAVSKQMNEFSRRLAEQQQQQQQQQFAGQNASSAGAIELANEPEVPASPHQLKTTFKFNEADEERRALRMARDRTHSRLTNRSYENNYHQHGQRSSKQNISTVAWMIVLGDGLHNFIDGISIGAAFSESILSGVSISVAVICEEFPHELGDFAVLVSAGMTVRQALGYNFLSACTCYLGMAVGIILGDVTDGASYISALAAGVFLYIALVDMMGELSAALEESSRDSITRTLKLLLLQNVGIFIGISIIFVLSFIDF